MPIKLKFQQQQQQNSRSTLKIIVYTENYLDNYTVYSYIFSFLISSSAFYEVYSS